ncbi:Uncharacterised protein [uncultured archaeon]|nr:Uncharacterised protein [uncultured archaeon]
MQDNIITGYGVVVTFIHDSYTNINKVLMSVSFNKYYIENYMILSRKVEMPMDKEFEEINV